MTTIRNKIIKKKKYGKSTRKYGVKKGKWTTAIAAGNKTLKTTCSLDKAKATLRSQALLNARKLFGSIGKTL